MKIDNASLQVQRSGSLKDACDLFLGDLKEWAYSCVERYAVQPLINNHDQLTYTTGWEPYLLASPDDQLISFLSNSRDKMRDYYVSKDTWRHGYWRMQEAHHGTEHFELFLGFMTRISPNNQTTTQQLIDAVEHIGNWSPDVPEWFDYSTGLFRSLHFGTDGIRPDEHQLNMPDHLRCANLLLLAYNVTFESKYLELADSYGEQWASAICNGDGQLPVGITRDRVLYELSGPGAEVYRSVAGMAGDLDTDLDRAENILASGGIELFLDLWCESGKTIFLDATTRLLTVLSSALSDVDAGPVADAIRTYRQVTGRHDFDQQIITIVDELSPCEIDSISMGLPGNLSKRPPGVGKRSDMPVWLENGKPRRHNPILLSVAAEIRDDQELATQSVDIARAYFQLAVQHLRNGRHHGCAARTVSAVARGHGRNNHAGMSTAVLLPVMEQFNLL